MKNSFAYSFKVWFLSIISIPLIAQFIHNFKRNYIPLKFWEIAGFWNYVIEDLQIGLYISFVSIPLFIVFFLINNEIQKEVKTVFKLKLSINLFSIFLIGSLFFFTSIYEQYHLIIVMILQTLAIWFFNITPIAKIAREDILDEKI